MRRIVLKTLAASLVKIAVSEVEGRVRWHTAPHMQPVEF